MKGQHPQAGSGKKQYKAENRWLKRQQERTKLEKGKNEAKRGRAVSAG